MFILFKIIVQGFGTSVPSQLNTQVSGIDLLIQLKANNLISQNVD